MGEPVRLVRTEIRRHEPYFLMESTGKMSELSMKLEKKYKNPGNSEVILEQEVVRLESTLSCFDEAV